MEIASMTIPSAASYDYPAKTTTKFRFSDVLDLLNTGNNVVIVTIW